MELTFDNVDHICAGLDVKSGTATIDLTDCTYFKPFGLVYLGQFLRYHTSIGVDFNITPPKDPLALAYLTQQRFWLRYNHSPEKTARERLQFFSADTLINDLIDIDSRPNVAEEIGSGMFRVLARTGIKVNHAVIVEIITELVDNFAKHSDCLLGALHVQYYPHRHEVAIGVGDYGIGIRDSLCKNLKYEYFSVLPHNESALKAFEPTVTSKETGGMGLTQVRELVLEANGQIILATGDGYVKATREKYETGIMAYNLRGVQVEVVLPEEGA